ncbi:T-protein [Candidatus Annandia adelgestsuga]|uniref:chorismate mutase n=1 Tax=Candidatus Annandia adelgestsuga TaxID=1302411 RepID=A0A3S5HNV7_9ENTR|nr:chorismate mutase [Candidatus Annandia adelgestsuga]AZP36154.1 T-protein [Candidatus Annandia adelgestsuga]
MVSEILSLRNKIDIIDKNIINLLSKRLNLVSKVGLIKSKYGIPIHVPKREKSIIKSRFLIADKLKISKKLIKDLMSRIMYESYLKEYSHGFKKVNCNIKCIIIISDNNYTGILFKKMLQLSKYNVYLFKPKEINKINIIKYKIDMIIISISNESLKKIMLFILKLSKNCILVNLNVISYKYLKLILYIHKGPVLLLQPKFNSQTYNLTKKKIYYCNGRNFKYYKWFLKQMKIWGLNIICIKNLNFNNDEIFINFLKIFINFLYGLNKIKKKNKSNNPLLFNNFNLKDTILFFKNNPNFYIDNIIFNKKNIILFIESYCNKFKKFIYSIKNNQKIFLKKFNKINKLFL